MSSFKKYLFLSFLKYVSVYRFLYMNVGTFGVSDSLELEL